MNQLKQVEANTCSRHKVRKNDCERVTIGFSFTSDWSQNWREFFKPTTKRSDEDPKQTQNTFDTLVKIALSFKNNCIKLRI